MGPRVFSTSSKTPAGSPPAMNGLPFMVKVRIPSSPRSAPASASAKMAAGSAFRALLCKNKISSAVKPLKMVAGSAVRALLFKCNTCSGVKPAKMASGSASRAFSSKVKFSSAVKPAKSPFCSEVMLSSVFRLLKLSTVMLARSVMLVHSGAEDSLTILFCTCAVRPQILTPVLAVISMVPVVRSSVPLWPAAARVTDRVPSAVMSSPLCASVSVATVALTRVKPLTRTVPATVSVTLKGLGIRVPRAAAYSVLASVTVTVGAVAANRVASVSVPARVALAGVVVLVTVWAVRSAAGLPARSRSGVRPAV